MTTAPTKVQPHVRLDFYSGTVQVWLDDELLAHDQFYEYSDSSADKPSSWRFTGRAGVKYSVEPVAEEFRLIDVHALPVHPSDIPALEIWTRDVLGLEGRMIATATKEVT